MPDLRELYQELILDHSKNPRNYRKLEAANRTAEGFNPLCGDHFHLYLRTEGDRIADISFEGNGCALSKASASMMTSALKGKTVAEAESLFQRFHRMVTGNNGKEDLGKLSVFAGVSEFPVRVKCVSLAWHTLLAALKGEQPVSTE
jgi:nitrogen fixation NifU-like protein